jgi:hypothetical protein
MKQPHARGWAAIQAEKPNASRLLYDPQFEWIKAEQHNTVDGLNKFRERQEKRRLAAQSKAAAPNVTTLKKATA